MNADERGMHAWELAATETLTRLLGLRLATAHNAGNMKMFHFGELHRIGERGLVGNTHSTLAARGESNRRIEL